MDSRDNKPQRGEGLFKFINRPYFSRGALNAKVIILIVFLLMALIVFWMQVTAPINPHSEANLARKAHRHLIAAERSTRQQDLSAAEDHLKEAAVYIEKLEKQKAKSGPPNKTSLWLKDTREKIEVSLRRQQSLRLAKEKGSAG